MVFNSLLFFLFLAVVLAIHRLPLSWKLKKVNLICISYFFYATWYPPYVLLLWGCTVVDWFIAKALAAAEGNLKRRILLGASLVTNLGILVFFKYTPLFARTINLLLPKLGIHASLDYPNVLLPIGISFFVFMSLSYTIDIYHRKTEPCKSFIDYALFITFFPHLVSGPIVRAAEFLPQCLKPVKANFAQFSWGGALLLSGLFEKIVIADYFMSPCSDKLFNSTEIPDMMSAWIGTMAFSIQILADFSGYTMCAIGIALMLGFEFPDNFRYPYGAVGFSDFWRRWHISLSSWLRDYLYIPLGGNRHGWLRTNINLFATMLLGGLWHGASWNFLIWGGLHGLYLVSERLINKAFPNAFEHKGFRPFKAALTYLAVCVAWVFFRSVSTKRSLTIVKSMLNLHSHDSHRLYLDMEPCILILIAAFLGLQWLMREKSYEEVAEKTPVWLRTAAIACMIVLIILSPGANHAFIYFQF